MPLRSNRVGGEEKEPYSTAKPPSLLKDHCCGRLFAPVPAPTLPRSFCPPDFYYLVTEQLQIDLHQHLRAKVTRLSTAFTRVSVCTSSNSGHVSASLLFVFESHKNRNRTLAISTTHVPPSMLPLQSLNTAPKTHKQTNKPKTCNASAVLVTRRSTRGRQGGT